MQCEWLAHVVAMVKGLATEKIQDVAPLDSVQLSCLKKWLNPRVYGRFETIVFMGFIYATAA